MKPSEVFEDINPLMFDKINQTDERYFCLYSKEIDIEYKKAERLIWIFQNKNKAYELMEFLLNNTEESVMGKFSLYIESNKGNKYERKEENENSET